MNIFWKKLLPVCLILGLQSCGNADRNGQDETATEIKDSISDTAGSTQTNFAGTDLDDHTKVFVSSAAIGGLAEVEMAGLAFKKSKDNSVKDFASLMLKDHGLANQQLENIAREKGIKLAKTLPEQEAGHLTEMNTLADRAFDTQYIRMMINDHEKMVQLFTDGSRLADPELRAFAVKMLPVIKQHHQTAEEIGKRLNIINANNGDDVLGLSPAKVQKNK